MLGIQSGILSTAQSSCRSEWAVGNEWLGRNTGAMLLATAYILLAGSYLEWCMILRSRYEVRSALGSYQLCTSACFLYVFPSACRFHLRACMQPPPRL